jgi:hypothetical protein
VGSIRFVTDNVVVKVRSKGCFTLWISKATEWKHIPNRCTSVVRLLFSVRLWFICPNPIWPNIICFLDHIPNVRSIGWKSYLALKRYLTEEWFKAPFIVECRVTKRSFHRTFMGPKVFQLVVNWPKEGSEGPEKSFERKIIYPKKIHLTEKIISVKGPKVHFDERFFDQSLVKVFSVKWIGTFVWLAWCRKTDGWTEKIDWSKRSFDRKSCFPSFKFSDQVKVWLKVVQSNGDRSKFIRLNCIGPFLWSDYSISWSVLFETNTQQSPGPESGLICAVA